MLTPIRSGAHTPPVIIIPLKLPFPSSLTMWREKGRLAGWVPGNGWILRFTPEEEKLVRERAQAIAMQPPLVDVAFDLTFADVKRNGLYYLERCNGC
jgi:hypothetical protein